MGWGGTTHRDSVEDGDSVQQDVGQQRGGLQRAGRQRQGAQHGEREQGTPGGRRGLAQADTGEQAHPPCCGLVRTGAHEGFALGVMPTYTSVPLLL